jgi:hypothetical protein
MARGKGHAGNPAYEVVEVAPNAAQAATEVVPVAPPAEFLECLGEVGNYFSSLERLLEQFIHTLSGAAANRHWSFRRKCRGIRALLKPEGNEAFVADICGWLDDCQEAADERNDAVHTPHARLSQKLLELREDGTKLPVTIEQLVALKALKVRIISLHSRGASYLDALPEVIERMAQAQDIQ